MPEVLQQTKLPQTDPPSKSAKLYRNLISDGYTQSNLGSESEFTSALADPNKAAKIYNGLLGDGYTVDNLGGMDDFLSTFQKKNPLPNVSKNTSTFQSPSNPQSGSQNGEVSRRPNAPVFNIIDKNGNMIMSKEDDPAGTIINQLESQRSNIIDRNRSSDATSIAPKPLFKIEGGKLVPDHQGKVDELDSQIESVKRYAFQEPRQAKSYLTKKLAGKTAYKKNDIFQRPEIITPSSNLEEYDLGSIKSNVNRDNITDQLAYDKFQKEDNLNNVLTSSQNLGDAAIKFAATQDPTLNQQIKLLDKTGDKLPEAYQGQLVANFLNNPDLIEKTKTDPQLAKQYDIAKATLLTTYPSYGKRVVGNIIGQERENRGMNSGITNMPTQASTDKLVDDLVSEGKLTPAEKNIYDTQIKPSLGILKSIGRGVGRLIPGVQTVVDESPIPTTGFFENLENSYVNTLRGEAHSIEDFTGGFNPQTRLKNSLQNDYSAVNIDPKGFWHELSKEGGTFTGFIAPMIMGGEVTKALGLGAKSGEITNMVLMFEGQNRDNAIKEFPNDTGKQFLYTTLATGGDAMLGRLLPTKEASKGISNAFKNDIKSVVDDFADNKITASAARNTLLKRASDFGSKIVKGNTTTGATMAGFNMFHNALDVAFGNRDVSLGSAANDAIQTFKSGFLGGTFISALASNAIENPKVNARALREMASNPEYYIQVINNDAILNPDLAASKSEKISNLNTAALINKDLEQTTLTDAQKEKYLVQALSQKIWEKKAENTNDDVIAKDYLQKAKDNLNNKQKIYQGLDKAPEYENFISSKTKENATTQSDQQQQASNEQGNQSEHARTEQAGSEGTPTSSESSDSNIGSEGQKEKVSTVGLSHGDWLDKNKSLFSEKDYQRLNEELISNDESIRQNAIDEIIAKKKEVNESVSVIKPKTQEEINNQIPTVTIAPKENTPETKQGVNVGKPTDEQIADDIKNQRFASFTYNNESEVPDVFKDKITTKSEGGIPTINDGKPFVMVTVPKSEADYELSKVQNATEKTAEVPKPTEAASTTNEAANKVEQPTEESEVGKQVKSVLGSQVAEGTDKEAENYAVEKVAEAPIKMKNDLGEDLFNKVLEKTPTRKLQDGLDYLLKNNPDSKDVDVLDRIISDREKQNGQNTTTPTEVNKPISVNEEGGKPAVLKDNDPLRFTKEGGNKVVDENGQPITVYHTSNNESITEFKTKGRIKTVGGEVENYGAYFTPNKGEYKNKGSREYEVNISLKNPFVTTDQLYSAVITKEKYNDLISKGHDGVILERKGKPDEYVVFDKSQIQEVKPISPEKTKSASKVFEYVNKKSPLDGQNYEVTNISDRGTVTLTPVEGKTKKEIKLSNADFERAKKQGFYKEKPISKPISEVKEKPSKPTNTKESNFSKKLKDKYKDFNLGGTKDADLSDKAKIKTDNGTQTIDEYVAKGKAVLNKLFPDATFEAYKTHEEFEKAGGVEDSRGTAITEADGSKRILLNLAQMKEDGVGKTAFHEVIHPIVAEVFGKTPEELAPIWSEIASTMKDAKGMDKVWEHLVWYSEHKTPVEGITEFLTQVADGNIKIEDIPAAKQSKIIELINKLFEKLGINFKIEHPLDLQKFANDIKTAFETGDVESLKNTIDKRSSENKNASENASKINDLLFGKDADFGLSKGNIKENVDKSIEALRKMIDKGADLKDAIAKESDNFIKNIKSLDGIKDLKPTFEKTLRDNFEKEALNQFSKEQSDKAATVENMVKDAMDEGFDNVNDIKEAITNGLGIDTPAFRKMIDDAYEKVKGGDGGKEPPESGMDVDNNSDTFSEWSRVNLGSLSKIKDQFRKIGISWDNRAESAMRNLQKRGRKGERLFDTALREMDGFHKSLSRGKTPRFNTDDQVAMHFLKIGTEQQIAKLKDNISEDYTDINSIGSDVLIDQYDRVNAVLGAMRSESGVGLAYGTVEARLSPDYGLKVRQMQMIRANDGEPLSEAQESLVKETWQKERGLMKREQEYRTKKMQDDFDKQLSDLKDKYEKEIQDLKNGKKVSKKITKSRAKLSDNLLDIAKRIRESNEFDNYLKNRGNDTKAAGVTFDFKEGAAQAIEYVAKAVKAGEKVTDAISKAVEKYKEDLDSKGVADFKEKLSGLITKASLPDANEVLSKIKDIADNEKTTQITKGMVGKNLIRDLVDSHIADTKKEDILAEATKKIQTVLPDVTKENITEAYLRQGDFKLDKKSKLEDIVKKDKLALKRIAKDELTANQKQKIKLSQEKEKAQRRIAELEDKLKNGEYDEEGQQIPVKLNRPDAELINFNREKNKLESVYRKEQEKIREKNRHIGFRIAETARALWVTILIGHPKTLAKIGWMMVIRPTSEAVSKLTFGKAFDLVSPEISSAAKAGGESNSIASVTKMSAAFFRQMGAEKLQGLYERGERKYYDALAKYEEYKNSSNPNEKRLKQLKRDMDNKMLATLGNTIYQFIGGSSLKDAFSALVHRANVIEKQFGKVSEEQWKGEDSLGKIKYSLGFIGRSHSALKTLSGRASFAAGFMARVEAQLAKGEHPNADKLIELAHESYIDWERGKYQQSNYISDKWNQMINSIDNRLQDKNKSWESYNKTTQLLARTDVAITRVPVNIIHEAVAEYLTGAFRAPILAKRAYNEANKQAIKEGYTKGLEVNDGIERGTTKEQFKNRIKEIVSEMDADKAATIVRLFRKGGLGAGLYAAALLWGGVHFGIFQHRGQKKVKEEEDLKPDELNPGQVMFGDTKYGEVVSGMIEHTPALWPTFMGLGLAKMYHDDINNGKTTASAAGDAIITHLKIVEGNIPQTKFIDPVEIGQTISRNVEKKAKSISDTWGLTDNAEIRGGLSKGSKARQYLEEHNIEVKVPERYQVDVEKDEKHPYGRMTEEDYIQFKSIRKSILEEKINSILDSDDELSRDEFKEKVKAAAAQSTKDAKLKMIDEGIISGKDAD